VALEPKSEIDILIQKMFEAAVKERFAQLAKKYDHDLVFNTWVNFIKKEFQPFPRELEWKGGMTLAEALASLETHFREIEEYIKSCGKSEEKS
jgi:tRNA isopentenyl-2-thiomethyl-A-37 hydroxylase MiaE